MICLLSPFSFGSFRSFCFTVTECVNTGKKLLQLRKIIVEGRQLILYYPVWIILKKRKNIVLAFDPL
jgi:hypothetical protein